MNKELFDLGVDIECIGKLICIQAKHDKLGGAKKQLNKVYTKLLLMYENGEIKPLTG